jgi:hypothetical protein
MPNPLGVNLDCVTDWNTSHFFTNVAMQARAFGNPATPWDGKAILGADGWPTQDFGACYITGCHIAGTYKLVATGKCTVVSLSGNPIANVTYNPATNTTTADVATVKGGNLYLSFVNTGGTLKNVRLYAPHYNLFNETYTDEFVDALEPFSIIRTMDFTATNNNPVAMWEHRTKGTDPTQAGPKGASWEAVIALANQTGKDIWINVPHQADQDYIAALAKLLKATLNPTSNVYVEYSNEVWNNQFGQTVGNYERAKADVLAGDKTLCLDGEDSNVWQWGFRRVAKKICQISKTFALVWENSPRIRPILASQIAIPGMLSIQLDYIERYFGKVATNIYGIAGAPYYNLSDETRNDPAASVDKIVTELDARCDYPKNGIAAYHALAKAHGVKSIAYEGGVDLGQDAATTDIKNKIASHYDARMKAITAKYLQSFYAGGGDEFVYYELAYTPNPHGHWGLTDSTLDLAQPKYLGAVDFVNGETPALEAGLPLGTIPFASYAFKSGFNAAPQPNGDVLYLQAAERFSFLVKAEADGVYPLSITYSAWAPITVEVLANGVAASHELPATAGKFTPVELGTVTLRKGLNGVAFKTAKCDLRSFTIGTATEKPMPTEAPTGTLKLFRQSAKAFDGIEYEWTAKNGIPHVLNGEEKEIPIGATSGKGWVAMPNKDLTITLVVTSPDPAHEPFRVSQTCKLADLPPVDPHTGNTDPIVSVVVVVTRKSGKVTNTPIS